MGIPKTFNKKRLDESSERGWEFISDSLNNEISNVLKESQESSADKL
jgi:hypothetical protein